MHYLSTDQFTKRDVIELFGEAERLRTSTSTFKPAEGKLLVNLFYEASTRTSSSFYAAMHKLGGGVLPINDVTFSSVSKGENLEDTIRTLASYADVIVLRHPEIGAAERASKVSSVPVINAGDGAGEHPTQALLDIYTIWLEHGREELDGLTVTLMGDLKHGRTVHSLVKLLRLFGTKINFVSPEHLRMPSEYLAEGDTETTNLDDVIADSDVLYVTRVQKERFAEGESTDLTYGVTVEHMSKAKTSMCLLHPLPRNEELPSELDEDPRAAYFRQMENGLWMRAAILKGSLDLPSFYQSPPSEKTRDVVDSFIGQCVDNALRQDPRGTTVSCVIKSNLARAIAVYREGKTGLQNLYLNEKSGRRSG